MFRFFRKISQEVQQTPLLDFGLLGMVGIFATKQLIQIQREKDELIKAHLQKKIIIVPVQGTFGTQWKWGVQEDRLDTPPAKKTPSP